MMEQVFSNNSLVGGLVPVKSVRVGVPHYLFVHVVAVDLFPRTSDKGATTGTLSVASVKRISKHPMFVRAIFGGDVAEGSVEVESWIDVLSDQLQTITQKRELFYANPGKVKF